MYMNGYRSYRTGIIYKDVGLTRDVRVDVRGVRLKFHQGPKHIPHVHMHYDEYANCDSRWLCIHRLRFRIDPCVLRRLYPISFVAMTNMNIMARHEGRSAAATTQRPIVRVVVIVHGRHRRRSTPHTEYALHRRWRHRPQAGRMAVAAVPPARIAQRRRRAASALDAPKVASPPTDEMLRRDARRVVERRAGRAAVGQ